MKFKRGFTLAEVLITLGIIGVVAAITMPVIIKNYQKQLFANKVKYTYSLLANVYERSKFENGDFSTWNLGAEKDLNGKTLSEYGEQRSNEIEQLVEKYFVPYLKIVKRIKTQGNGYHIVIANGITLSFFTDGTAVDNIYRPNALYIIASNNNNTNSYSHNSRDYTHHDTFFMISYNKFGFFKKNNYKTDTKFGCNLNVTKNARYNCSGWIMQNGWKIPDDYPW